MPIISKKAHFLTGMLVFGTATAVSMKMQLEMECTGYGEQRHAFDKPFFQSIAMFLAMSLALPIQTVFDAKKKKDAQYKPLSDSIQDTDKSEKPSASVLVVMIPCIFDLVGSTMMTFGLIYISVSVMQMLRGSMVIFSAIFTRIFLGKKVQQHQYYGIVLCLIALVMVGIAGAMIPQANMKVSTMQVLGGILLVILSQVIQAGQLVTEEFFLKNLTIPPLKIVGYEGIWGTLLMIFVACPLAFIIPGTDYSIMPHNSLENSFDSMICMVNQPMIIVTVLVFMLAVMFYNIYGMLITNEFSAVNRTIFEAVRTSCIWATNIFIHIVWPDSPYGEMWVSWSWLELGGFIVLFSSSMIYNKIIKLPWVKYEEEEKK
eukprot:TRINITY_DN175_c0_g1_i3.p1 TRINITY_DN175_c0_g1~~TRINITY_DN175_c0_g1_i3.p1  ORF type:complete len:373 (+),score=112.80 TRINITY_DN175_c0_g1_i3:29-1147(+)